MPAFSFRVVDAAGRRIRGVERAPSAGELQSQLESRGLLVLTLEAEESSLEPGRGRLRRRDPQAVLILTRHLASLLPAGLPLSRALRTAAAASPRSVRDVLEDVRARVDEGAALAAALEVHPDVFSPLYIGLVRAGESSGDLAGAFGRLAVHLEREAALRARLLSALLYPFILAIVGGLALLVLVLFVLPRFVALLEGAGAGLPASTSLLLSLSDVLRERWAALFVLSAFAAVGLTAFLGTVPGRRAAAGMLLGVPGLRTLRRKALAARMSRLLTVLLSGGTPLLVALADAAESISDPLAREEILRIRARIREGASFEEALAEGTLFPPLLGQLVQVGGESGQLDAFLAKAAEMFEEETARALERLVTLAEPAMIIGMGAVVAFVALSLLQAIYGMNAGAFR